jgi:molybdopterin-guanine dinucleotide biosynthesis protein
MLAEAVAWLSRAGTHDAPYKSDAPCRSAVISINACKDLSTDMHTDENSDLTINAGKDTSARTVADKHTFTKKNKLTDSEPKADLILVEGFKRLTFPKIGIARLATGKGFCSEETAFLACVSDILKPDKELCRFTLDDYEGISSFIIENMDRLI